MNDANDGSIGSGSGIFFSVVEGSRGVRCVLGRNYFDMGSRDLVDPRCYFLHWFLIIFVVGVNGVPVSVRQQCDLSIDRVLQVGMLPGIDQRGRGCSLLVLIRVHSVRDAVSGWRVNNDCGRHCGTGKTKGRSWRGVLAWRLGILRYGED